MWVKIYTVMQLHIIYKEQLILHLKDWSEDTKDQEEHLWKIAEIIYEIELYSNIHEYFPPINILMMKFKINFGLVYKYQMLQGIALRITVGVYALETHKITN